MALETTIKLAHESYAIKNTKTDYIVFIGSYLMCQYMLAHYVGSPIIDGLVIVQLTADKPLEFKVQ